MSDEEANSEEEDTAEAEGDIQDMGVRLIARSADGTKLVNTLDVFPRFELSI